VRTPWLPQAAALLVRLVAGANCLQQLMQLIVHGNNNKR
jgi:hypothetical protein